MGFCPIRAKEIGQLMQGSPWGATSWSTCKSVVILSGIGHKLVTDTYSPHGTRHCLCPSSEDQSGESLLLLTLEFVGAVSSMEGIGWARCGTWGHKGLGKALETR